MLKEALVAGKQLYVKRSVRLPVIPRPVAHLLEILGICLPETAVRQAAEA
jgi:hypothetical protein